MEYVYDAEQEHTWPEFFEIYKEQFPLLTYITGGHYGGTSFNDFCNDQIYRVQTYTNQRRVVIKATKTYDPGTDIYLSVPVSSKHKFCVIRSHRSTDEPKTLGQILKEREFPISVKFSKNEKEIHLGTSTEDPQSFATMLITRDYTENFLLGNCIVNGKVESKVTVAALSDQISVSVVTGIAGQSEENFQKHLTDIKKRLHDKGVKYDTTAGNPNITIITCNGTGTGNPIPKLNPPLISTMTSTTSSEGNDSFEGEDAYESLLLPGEPPKLPPRSKNLPKRPIRSSSVDSNQNVRRPLPLPGNSPACSALTQTRNKYQNVAFVHPSGNAQNINDTGEVNDQSESARKHQPVPNFQTENSESEYVPFNPKAMNNIRKEGPKKERKLERKESQTDVSENATKQMSDTPVHLENLTIRDIGSMLRTLKLDEYVDRFANDMIDGVILAEFSKTELKEVFGFNTVEQIRLWKFIMCGHIPK